MLEVNDKKLAGYTFIDLFAGLGGFHLALASLGAECVYASEWDKHAKKVYKKNHGIEPDGDITKVDENTIPEHDILCAGFPCQAFSIAGKRMGFEDSRGTLFFDIARIVKAKRPKLVFMENVKNFEAHDNGNTLEVVKRTMLELGYSFDYKVLNASDYGVPQARKRIYMVCFRNDIDPSTFTFPEKVELQKRVRDLLLPENEVEKFCVNHSNATIFDDVNYTNTKNPIRVGIVNKGYQGERIYSIDGTAITLSSNGGGVFSKTGGYLVNGKIRKLHPRECARLMGYPDTFQLDESNTQACKQLGNSVVVDVLQYIALSFADTLNGVPKE